jgi:hypothetical protein
MKAFQAAVRRVAAYLTASSKPRMQFIIGQRGYGVYFS